MTTTTLEKLERLDRFKFYNGNKVYQYSGVQDGYHQYFSVETKKFPITYSCKIGSNYAKRPVIIQP